MEGHPNIKIFIGLCVAVSMVEIFIFIPSHDSFLKYFTFYRKNGFRANMGSTGVKFRDLMQEVIAPNLTRLYVSDGKKTYKSYPKDGEEITAKIQEFWRSNNLLKNTTAVDSVEDAAGGRRIVTLHYPIGRLGNQMFSFASFIGIALSRNLAPQLYGSNCNKLIKYFQINITCNATLMNKPVKLERFPDYFAAKYNSRVESLSNDPSKNPLLLKGYMQSWKYFDKHRAQILQYFTFRDEIIQKSALRFKELLSMRATEMDRTIVSSNMTLIGMHVRRTDMTTNSSHKRGYVEAPKDYLEAAMTKMESLLPNTSSIVYVVISDDMKWCTSAINRSNRTVIFFKSGAADQDLAMMAGCNHSIITSGTFGWWGAYLAGGRVIYYSRYPRPRSYIAKVTDRGDYYPPDWVGIP